MYLIEKSKFVMVKFNFEDLVSLMKNHLKSKQLFSILILSYRTDFTFLLQLKKVNKKSRR